MRSIVFGFEGKGLTTTASNKKNKYDGGDHSPFTFTVLQSYVVSSLLHTCTLLSLHALAIALRPAIANPLMTG